MSGNSPDYRDPQSAFEATLASGRLSHDRKAANYVGRFMYMGTKDGHDLFKASDTREYLK